MHPLFAKTMEEAFGSPRAQETRRKRAGNGNKMKVFGGPESLNAKKLQIYSYICVLRNLPIL